RDDPESRVEPPDGGGIVLAWGGSPRTESGHQCLPPGAAPTPGIALVIPQVCACRLQALGGSRVRTIKIDKRSMIELMNTLCRWAPAPCFQGPGRTAIMHGCTHLVNDKSIAGGWGGAGGGRLGDGGSGSDTWGSRPRRVQDRPLRG